MSLRTLWNDVRSRRGQRASGNGGNAPVVAPLADPPAPEAPARRPFVPDGHFYSPVIDIDAALRDQARIWRKPPEAFGVDFNRARHEQLLSGPFRTLLADYQYPQHAPADGQIRGFYEDNPMFGLLDPRALFVMMRMLRPRRMIEVGSGFSSLLAADVNRRFLSGRCEITCIEPYPPPFLQAGVAGISQLIAKRVQEVPDLHEQLAPGDILFIDSSHVAKTGSDVNHLYLNVLPRLARGVVVHVHDIFLPYEYPKGWVVDGRSWNEQYILQAMLASSHSFKILFACYYSYHQMRESLAAAMDGKPLEGCSFWMEKTGPA